MKGQLTRHTSSSGAALAVVVLLGLAFALCLVHGCHDQTGDLEMLAGACGTTAVVVSLFAAGPLLASVNWLLPSLAVSPYAVSLHLLDPPPKSPALL